MDADDDNSSEMIDDIYSNADDAHRRRPVLSGELLDVEAYGALYSGRTKITRLLFIAEQFPDNPPVQLEALRMAYDEIKKGENTDLFREVVLKIDGRLGNEYGDDPGWAESVERRAEQRKDRLENELNAYGVPF